MNYLNELQIFIPFCLNILLVYGENLTNLLELTTIGQKQCTGACYNRGSCRSFSYNNHQFQCSLFINDVVPTEEHLYQGKVQTGLRNRADISTVEAGRCIGHTCPEGSTCYFLKNGTKICLHTECVIPPPTVANGYIIDASPLYKLKDIVHYKCNVGYLLTGNNEVFCRAGGNWSNVNFYCKDCGTPTELNGAFVSNYQGSTIGKWVYYKCEPGYQATWTVKAKCLSSTVWSAPTRQCLPMCTPFPVFPDSQKKTTQNWRMLGRTVVYTCNIGYEPPTFSIKCIDNTYSNDSLVIWSDPTANCSKVDCGPPINVHNANYGQVNVTTYLETITYSCNDSMVMSGDLNTSTCQANRTWTETNLVCAECGKVPIPAGAVNLVAHRGAHDTIQLTCTSDYIQTGTLNAKCENGTWDLGTFICWWKHCSNPPFISGAWRSFTGTIVGHVATHKCRNAYVDVANVGNVKSTCQLGGNWSDAFINCSKNCYTPPAMANAIYPSDITTYHGSVVFYTCKSRFTLVGSRDNATCAANGDWIGPDFECVPDCKTPPVVPNTKPASYNSTLHTSNAQYDCSDGFTVIDNPLVTCKVDSKWSTVMFVCVACSYPPYLNDTTVGVILEGGVLKVTYICDNNLKVIGNSIVTCQANQVWTDPLFFCSACSDPPLVDNAVLHIDLVQSDSLVTYDCNAGFYFVGEKYIYCQNDATWSIRKFLCSACGEPPVVQTATYTVDKIGTEFKVRYRCTTGLLLVGNDIVDCQANNDWTYPTLICSGCPTPPAVSNALINVALLNHSTNVIQYKCQNGYNLIGDELITCQNDLTWTTAGFVCVQCQYPSNITKATFNLSLSEVEIFQYFCDDGLNLIGNKAIQCQSGGTWTNAAFDCSFCPEPPLIVDTSIVVDRSSTITVQYTCNTGLTLHGDGIIHCNEGTSTWTTPVFFCSSCSDPPLVGNAVLHIDPFQNDSLVTYDCSAGFHFVGEKYIHCQNDATWSVRKFLCSACGEPPVVERAAYIVDKIGTEFKVRYGCSAGLLLVGNDVLDCQANNDWTYPTFICTECPIPPTVSNALINVQLLNHSTNIIKYTCQNGYNLIGDELITCQNDSIWTTPAFVCVQCECPPSILEATFNLSLTETEMFQYYCDAGLYLIGNKAIQCQSGGAWTDAAFDCSVCPEPPPIVDTSIVVDRSATNITVQYTCDSGLTLHGDGIIHCNEGILTWTTPAFVCSECPEPPVIENAIFKFQTINSVTSFYYECNAGLNLHGMANITCQSGVWVIPPFVCNNCSAPPVIQNTISVVGNTWNDPVITYECDNDLDLIGNTAIECLPDATWSSPAFICTECSFIPVIYYADLNEAVLTPSEQVLSYQCVSGYTMIGFGNLTCQSNSSWSDPLFVCVPCPYPPNFADAILQFDANADDKFQYTCNNQLNLIGTNSIQCFSNGTWSPRAFTCSACQNPPQQPNATLQLDVNNNGTFKYACNNGLHLFGGDTLICQPDGTWSVPTFTCSACPTPPQLPSATVQMDLNSNPPFQYKCNNPLHLIGNGILECQTTGAWTIPMFKCSECASPPSMPNATLNVETENNENILRYSCNSGNILTGVPSLDCQMGGWIVGNFTCS